jgi:hypothetical protein
MYEQAKRYASEHPEDSTGILRRYNNVEKEFQGTPWATQATQAVTFEEVRAYERENPQDTEEILRRYNEVAKVLDGTEWASRAKQAILDIGYRQLEDALKEGPGNLDKLLLQLEQIQETTPDEEFARNVAERIERLREARKAGTELEFRRFRDGIEKLLKEGKLQEVVSNIENYKPSQQGRDVRLVHIKQFKEETLARVELDSVARNFYDAALKEDWEKAVEFVDPRQMDDEKTKRSFQFIGRLLFGLSRPTAFRVTEVDVNMPKGTAVVHGRLTVMKRMRNGRFQASEVAIEQNCVHREGKWYIQLPKMQTPPDREEKERPRNPRFPRKPGQK